ncbi:TonB-dependent receptor [Rhizobium rhizosphaerae]|uniref:TonB-dependent receptor n=2 Tax=Xaviernesmea rhizosphaerae TaxID=1672749 RepID=A0ABX3PH73_9HYPH|nr:TonB-dependent receptor [Xaviernesmea rhizosphaerae]
MCVSRRTSVCRGAGAALRAALMTSAAFAALSPAVPMMVRPAAAQAKQLAVSVPAGPLTPALNSLAAQTGLQILFDASLAQGKTSRGARGTLTPDQALSAVLSGTGVRARFAGSNQVSLSADTTTTGAVTDNGDTLLDTITIYGARNATTLQGTTSSVGVVSAEAIEQGEIRTLQDSYRRLANVLDSATVNSGFVIRGMSSEGLVPSGGPAGSVYIDGILQTRYNARFGARNLWDVEQVEVYRGPQSTLSGRAAMTGAVYVKSKDPTFEKEAEVSTTVGSDHLFGTAIMVNTPLVEDQIALRIAGAFERSDAYVPYDHFGNYAGYDDLTTDISRSIRAKLLITPAEMPDTRALITYQYSKDRPNDALVGYDTLADGSPNPNAGRGDFNFPSFTEFRATATHNLGAEITHDFSNALRFTSMTGYQYGINTRASVDYGTPGNVNGSHGEDDDSIFTQEFRLNYDEGPWKWVAGVYGSHQIWNGTTDFVVLDSLQQSDSQHRKTTNLAVFGEATYEFVPTWFATLGGRLDYLKDTNTEKNYFGAITSSPVLTGDPATFNEVNFVPKVGISKELDANQTLGLTYSQGFRSGGSYIDRQDPANTKLVTYQPEYSQNVELSYKGTLLDDRLTLNANLFYTHYEDQQVEIRPSSPIPGYRVTQNAAKSRAWGFEIEPNYRFTEQFSAFASLGYLNTKFLDFSHGAIGDQSGKSFPEAPEWTLGLGGRYEFENGFFLGADAKYTSDYNSRFGSKGMYKIDSRVIVNAQAGYKKNNWEITAFAENLTDEKYYTLIDPDYANFLGAYPFGQAGKPRTFGLNVRAKF